MTSRADEADTAVEGASGRLAAAAGSSAAGTPSPPGALPVLVLGYGNTLRRDDGVGVQVAERLADDARLMPDIEGGRVIVSTAHQLTPEVALDFAAASLVVLIDADLAGLAGAVVVRELTADGEPGSDERAAPGSSSHHVGARELLALARELAGAAPPTVCIGIGVADLELGEGLSGPVQEALPRAVEVVFGIVEQHLEG
jgi:hydrogenase maturation protease